MGGSPLNFADICNALHYYGCDVDFQVLDDYKYQSASLSL